MKKYYEVFLSNDGKVTVGETIEKHAEGMQSSMYLVSGPKREGVLVIRKSLKTCFSVMKKYLAKNVKETEAELNKLKNALSQLDNNKL